MDKIDANVYDIKTKKKIERSNFNGDIERCLDLRDIVSSRNTILGVLDEDRFKCIKVETKNIANNKSIKHYVVDDGLPVFQVNEFLDTKNDKENTGRKYGNIMCRFLNYLDKRNLNYLEVDNNVVEAYIKFRIFGGDTNLKLMKSPITFKTIMDDVSVIKQFYKWLTKRCGEVKISFHAKKATVKASYLYAEIGSTDYEEIATKYLNSLGESREYIKWYTDDEIEAILSNFRTTRDKAIFLFTVDGGMRIDEVLSVKRKGYDAQRGCATPSRSKSKKLRTIKLSKRACDMVNNYLLGEREDAEYESCKQSPYLFINLNKGKKQGEPVAYHNFRKILRRASKRAGLPEKQIRTHSGRSTKAMEYLKAQARYPELNLTDSQIATNMGWESIDTIKHYKDHQNEELGMMAQEKINRIKDNNEIKSEV